MAKFKKGDRVRVISTKDGNIRKGLTGTVDEGNSDIPWVNLDNGVRDWTDEDNLERIPGKRGRPARPVKVNFLLKYDLDEDPIEEFETMQQVEARIRELEQDETLQRDSMVVYEIKSKNTVEFETGFKLKAA